MYFTENKELQRFEREMKIVPNFERKEVWEYADSCNECKNYKCKLEVSAILISFYFPELMMQAIIFSCVASLAFISPTIFPSFMM